MKIAIFAMGPGETAQGIALAKNFLTEGHCVTFGVILEDNLKFLETLNCPKIVFKDGKGVEEQVNSGSFDIVIFCNSKMCGVDPAFRKNVPKNKPLCVSLDSNWLFNQPKYFSYISWLDKIYLNFPEDVYNFGLQENGGNYNIPKDVATKIKTVGLIPSYPPLGLEEKEIIRNKLGVLKEQKLIFAYIGIGVTFHNGYHAQFIKLINQLCGKHQNVKVLYLSGEEPHQPWLISTGGHVDSQTFYKYLASSDLVLQHQGLATLEQAISACVPVVANVVEPNPIEKIHTHAWEVGPFEKAGLCKMHYFSDGIDQVINSVEKLLFSNERGKMIKNQKEHYSQGEKNMLADIKEVFNKSI